MPCFIVSTFGFRSTRSVKFTSFVTFTGIHMPSIAAPNSHLDSAEGPRAAGRARGSKGGGRTPALPTAGPLGPMRARTNSTSSHA
eukprot:1996764-Pyramimonas_sp.AAC.1